MTIKLIFLQKLRNINVLRIFRKLLGTLAAYLFVLYVAFAAIMVCIPDVGRLLTTSSHVTMPIDYGNLSQFNMSGHTFFIDQGDTMIQTWYIPPINNPPLPFTPDNPFAPLADKDQTILFFCHGNLHTLENRHHIYRLKRMSNLGFHVVTLDYRGFGRSAGTATGNSMLRDASKVWKFVRKRSGTNPILLYGHSLGGGMCSQLAFQIQSYGHYVPGIVIESSFSSIGRQVSEMSVFKLYPPIVLKIIVGSIDQFGLTLDSVKALSKLPDGTPIVIVHAEDDPVVHKAASIAFRDALRANGRRSVFHLLYKACHDLGHHIFQDHHLLVEDIFNGFRFFVEQCYDRTNGNRLFNCTERIKYKKAFSNYDI